MERDRASLRSLRSWAVGFLMGVFFAAVLALAYPDKFAGRLFDSPRPAGDGRTNPMRLKKSPPAEPRRMASATTVPSTGAPRPVAG